ncbi:hypothetical protein [Allorhizobium taibaishanense]|uniref:Uncharacterized protein n=1 Tax=Allorhizobium taibaishanense TaxID=887144 RepID=A0A1Q9AC00_9HYPH|nr:hypothetical protein [Allorhizobium taibaishanense]MBB4010285.1 hypothetical protein [Allorhizobium taibaishanense]OLP52391.1 hypothetical protein BJF91_02370 [Allorhizobium taibaishanense]
MSDDEKWLAAKSRYKAFREDRDSAYLLKIVMQQFQDTGRIGAHFGRLANQIMAAKNAGDDYTGIVALADYIDEPFDAEPSEFEDVAKQYWRFERLAHEYQSAIRLPILPDAIYLPGPQHYEEIVSPFGKHSNRVDQEDNELDAVFRFLAGRFKSHPHMVYWFAQFRDAAEPGESAYD